MAFKRNTASGLVDPTTVRRWSGSAMVNVESIKRWTGSAWATAWTAITIAINGSNIKEGLAGYWTMTYGTYTLDVTPVGGATITNVSWSITQDTAGGASISPAGYFQGLPFDPMSVTKTANYTVQATFLANGVPTTRTISGTYRYN